MSELLDELMKHAVGSRCSCAVCHRLREEYIKQLEARKEK